MNGEEGKTKVTILTSTYRVKGYIDLLPGSRVTDFMAEARDFIAVTNAEVWELTLTNTSADPLQSASFTDDIGAMVAVKDRRNGAKNPEPVAPSRGTLSQAPQRHQEKEEEPRNDDDRP